MMARQAQRRPRSSSSAAWQPVGRLGIILLGMALLGGGGMGCAAIATSPTWVGGGMAVTGPLRLDQEEAEASAERQRLAAEPDQIGARHILVMHVDSKTRPEGVTRTREEARARAQECLLKVRAGADFGELVASCSDEPGSAERGGDLGLFKREVMVKTFSDAAFGLKVGEISELVETPYGFHIIKRTR